MKRIVNNLIYYVEVALDALEIVATVLLVISIPYLLYITFPI